MYQPDLKVRSLGVVSKAFRLPVAPKLCLGSQKSGYLADKHNNSRYKFVIKSIHGFMIYVRSYASPNFEKSFHLYIKLKSRYVHFANDIGYCNIYRG